MEEAIQKMASGQIKPDVFFTDTDKINSLVEARLIQPLNHSYIPSLKKDIWADYQNPFYDQQWRYTVPYVTWTTRHRVPPRPHLRRRGQREGLRHPVGPQVQRQGRPVRLLPRRDRDGPHAQRREGHQHRERGRHPRREGRHPGPDRQDRRPASRSTACTWACPKDERLGGRRRGAATSIGAQFYLPKGTKADVLGYWYPEKQGDYDVGNDTITVPSSAARTPCSPTSS